MSFHLQVSILACFVLILFYRYVLHPLLISPLSSIPAAHPLAAISTAWISYQRRRGHEIRSIKAAHKKYGQIIRLSPTEVSVASLDGLRQIYTAGFEKDRWYVDEFMNYQTPNLVSMLDHRPHSVQKRMISHVYSKSFIHSSPDMQKVSSIVLGERFLPAVGAAADAGQEVNVLEFSQASGMDFMSAYLFGLSNSTDFIRNIPERREYFSTFKAKYLNSDSAATSRLEASCLSLCRKADAYLHSPSVEKSSQATHPVVYSQLAGQLAKTTSAPRIEAVASEMFDHLLASHEATGITMTYIMHSLSQRPELQSALRSELLTLSPTFSASPGTSSAMNLPHANALDALPLLNAIVYETLRVYPAAPAPQPRIAPKGGAVIEGFKIPEGTRVSTNAHVMHRHEGAYPNADEWICERWLKGDGKGKGGEKIAGAAGGTVEMRRWFWAFGSGGRMCVGSNFALLGESMVL